MLPNDRGHLELTVTTEGAWRVSDMRVPEDDALHVVAFLESRDERVEVVWLRGSVEGPALFESLQTAIDAIDEALSEAETRIVSAGNDLASPGWHQ